VREGWDLDALGNSSAAAVAAAVAVVLARFFLDKFSKQNIFFSHFS
jgi:hypothetical protein